ncbi:MAG: ribosomal-processing cysteine protease Prp [Tyzzerella sp.]|nr:ribosomal-processing cysteine protease Prp [Tyzzerella sp.]
MTRVTIYKNAKNECVGFKAFGHADYAEEGEDIVCAAISVLTINTMNAIEAFTDSEASLVADDEDGFMEYRILGKPTKETTLLLETMVLGLQTMVDDENYSEYIDLEFREV